ncbi:amino acid adenylation domain-containing protein [Amycolatopsis sp. NPDC059020]
MQQYESLARTTPEILDPPSAPIPSKAEPVTARIARRARAEPDRAAVVHGERSLSYAELFARAGALAAILRSHSVGRDVLVPLWLDRSPELVIGALATWLAGGAYVGMDTKEPPARAESILADCASPVVLTTRSLAGSLPPGAPPAIVVDEPVGPTGGGVLPRSTPTGGDLSYVTFTSGSTGRPKGVLVEQQGVADLVDWYVDTFRIMPGDRMPQVARPSFDGWALEVWPCLAGGATLCVTERQIPDSPQDFVDWLCRQRVSVGFFTTALAVQLLRARWPADGGSMRAMLLGGEKLHAPPTPHPPFRLYHVYGPTEATMLATCGEIRADAAADTPPPIGYPLPGLTAHVLDSELRPVPDGEAGELHLSGAAVARGYLNRADETTQRFREDPYAARPGVRMYATGDLVARLPDGRLAFLGRTDDQVKLRGFRIEPGEIERSLLAVAGTALAAVVVHEPGGGATRQLVGYWCATDETRAPSTSTLRDHLTAVLPQYMIPHALVQLDALPVNAHGKIDRRALATRPLPADAGSAGGETPCLGPTEQLLAKLWGRVLGQFPASRDDNFFDLGGDSLLAMRLAADAKRHGLHLNAEDMFETDALFELADLLDRRAATGPLAGDYHA